MHDRHQPALFATSWQKLMMWVFIVGDALLFGTFLVSYGWQRMVEPSWPDQAKVFHMNFITAMTFTLITSSATMATAVGAARKGDLVNAGRFVWLTVIGGLAFLGCQAYEWAGLIHEGARVGSNPWGPASFGAYFFMITGFHGTHVLIGVIILAITAIRSAMKKATAEGVEMAGLYWHFVDLVWVFVFGTFYLI